MADAQKKTVTVQEMSEQLNSLDERISTNDDYIAKLQSDDDTEYTFTISNVLPRYFNVNMDGALIKRKNGFFAISGIIHITNTSLGNKLSIYESNVRYNLGSVILSNVQIDENKSIKTYATMTLNTTNEYASKLPPKCCVCKVDATLSTNGALSIGIYRDTFTEAAIYDLDTYQKWDIFLPETTMIGTRQNSDS